LPALHPAAEDGGVLFILPENMLQPMKKKILQVLLITGSVINSSSVNAQITPVDMQQYMLQKKYAVQASLEQFYNRLNYRTAWIQAGNSADRNLLFNALSSSGSMGLRETDYDLKYIASLRTGLLHLKNKTDSLEAELRVTATALQFYKDLASGNVKPALGYNGLDYTPGCVDIPALLADQLAKKTLHALPGLLNPRLPEIKVLLDKIRHLYARVTDSSFREVTITSNKVTKQNTALITKLYQLGISGIVEKDLHDSSLRLKVKEAQLHFNLQADGLLNPSTLRELNVPLKVRLQQLDLSVNYYRWLDCLTQSQPVIVVNIPAAYLKVYEHNKVILEMRMVVGKPSTPTPTLASKVNEVILYPYWHVPYSIATKELLPAFKRNPRLVNAGNYQVLDRSGKIIDPYAVNWKALGRSNFPYLIRQSTGCDNALGLLKLNFYSPFGVYLHDTPGKNTFKLSRRYLSHGCMRMEKPMEMGHLVLRDNHIAIDTLDQKGCLRNQSPINVKASRLIPVIAWYNPAGVDKTGRVLFYEDVYRKFNWSYEPVQ
jgi:L,D-transpeptidase YcbB